MSPCESLPVSTAPYYREARVTFVRRQTACRMRHCCARRIDGTGGKRKLLRTPARWAERQRIVEAEANRIAMLNAAPPRAGILIPEAKGLFKPETANQTPFFWTVTPPVFFLGKENGGCGFAARRRHIPAPLGRENPPPVGLQRRKEPCMNTFM